MLSSFASLSETNSQHDEYDAFEILSQCANGGANDPPPERPVESAAAAKKILPGMAFSRFATDGGSGGCVEWSFTRGFGGAHVFMRRLRPGPRMFDQGPVLLDRFCIAATMIVRVADVLPLHASNCRMMSVGYGKIPEPAEQAIHSPHRELPRGPCFLALEGVSMQLWGCNKPTLCPH